MKSTKTNTLKELDRVCNSLNFLDHHPDFDTDPEKRKELIAKRDSLQKEMRKDFYLQNPHPR